MILLRYIVNTWETLGGSEDWYTTSKFLLDCEFDDINNRERHLWILDTYIVFLMSLHGFFCGFMQSHPKILPCTPAVLAVQPCPASRLCAKQSQEVDVAEIKILFFPPWISFQLDKFLNQFQNIEAQMLIPAWEKGPHRDQRDWAVSVIDSQKCCLSCAFQPLFRKWGW